jgi:hypothetical protein
MIIWRLNEALYSFNLNPETEPTSRISCLFNPNTSHFPAETLSHMSRILHKMTILHCNLVHRYLSKRVLGNIFEHINLDVHVLHYGGQKPIPPKLITLQTYYIESETTFPFS